MKALIIAAGEGKRLKKLSKATPKPLVKLLGLSLIEKVILTAKKVNINEFIIVIGYLGEKIKERLGNGEKYGVKISYIENIDWQNGNGISVLKAKELLKQNFILLMSDHIFQESILRKLMNEKIKNDEIMLAVDYNIKNNKLIDINDVTKVLIKNSEILNIGKHLVRFNAYDTGIFLCSSIIFSVLEESIKKGDSSLSGGVRTLASKRKVRTFNIERDFWIDVDDEKSYKLAEKTLLNNLKKTTDGPISRYLNRPISKMITKQLVKTKISPNCISFFSFILSILGAYFFFLGKYSNLVIGAVLAQMSSIIDGCDGEIARLKFEETEFGGWFDAVLDRYADAFLLFCLTYYIYFIDKNFIVIFIGFLAIIGSFMNSYTADKYDGLMKKKLEMKKHYFRIGRDIRIFIIFLGAVFNYPYISLISIAVLMNIENIRRIIFLYKYGK